MNVNISSDFYSDDLLRGAMTDNFVNVLIDGERSYDELDKIQKDFEKPRKKMLFKSENLDKFFTDFKATLVARDIIFSKNYRTGNRCELCVRKKPNISLESAHIIKRIHCKGKLSILRKYQRNFLTLCPNHHTQLDKKQLNRSETSRLKGVVKRREQDNEKAIKNIKKDIDAIKKFKSYTDRFDTDIKEHTLDWLNEIRDNYKTMRSH